MKSCRSQPLRVLALANTGTASYRDSEVDHILSGVGDEWFRFEALRQLIQIKSVKNLIVIMPRRRFPTR
jgi:hypothetical protein